MCLTYVIIYVLIHQIIFRFYLLKYSLFFSSTVVLTSFIDVVFILSIWLHCRHQWSHSATLNIAIYAHLYDRVVQKSWFKGNMLRINVNKEIIFLGYTWLKKISRNEAFQHCYDSRDSVPLLVSKITPDSISRPYWMVVKSKDSLQIGYRT